MTDKATRVALYVGDLKPTVTEATLFDLFNAIGPVASTRVVRNKVTRQSQGYAYVNFHNPDDAKRAVTEMNLTMIKGAPCRVMFSERDPAKRKSGKGNVIVKNLSMTWDDKTLFEAFSIFGKIVSAKVVKDKNGQNLGYGYVRFEKEDEAGRAMGQVHGLVLGDSRVTVEKFLPKRQRPWTNVYTKYVPIGYGDERLCELFSSDRVVEQVRANHRAAMLEFENKKTDLQAKGQSTDTLAEPEERLPLVIVSSVYWENKFGHSSCIKFKYPEQARAAVAALNGYVFSDEELARVKAEQVAAAADEDSEKEETEEVERPGQPLYVGRAMTRWERIQERRARASEMKRNTKANLFVKNFKPSMNDRELMKIFSEFGKVVSARVARDRVTHNVRGFGFVQFVNEQDAHNAMNKLNGDEKLGNGSHPLFVSRFMDRTSRLNQRRNQRRRQISHQQTSAPPNPFVPGQFTAPMTSAWPGMPMGMAPRMPMGQFGAAAAGGFPRPLPPYAGSMFPQMPMQMQPFGRALGGIPPVMGTSQPAAVTSASVHSRPMQVGSVGIGPGSMRQSGVATAPHPPSAPTHSQPATEGGGASSHLGGGVSSAMMREQAAPLTSESLSAAKPQERKRMIGERLFPKIQEIEPRLAGKITGMLLEMDNQELLVLLGDQGHLLKKINEALAVLKEHQMRQSAKNSGKNLSASAGQASAPH